MKFKMNIIYACEPFPTIVKKTVFLAGPTNTEKSWRENALKELQKQGYDGTVFVPEPRNGKWRSDYDEQVIWEDKALNRSDAILFWIPRDLKDMPGLTTNDEWGYWKSAHPSKLILGAPDYAEKVRYQKFYAEKLGIETAETLEDSVKKAIAKIGDGAERKDQECLFSIDIWNNKCFQEWKTWFLQNNIIDEAKTLFTLKSKSGSKMGKLSSVIIHFVWSNQIAVFSETANILFKARARYPVVLK